MDEFDYDLPEARIAQEPVEPRHAARLLVALAGAPTAHRRVADLPDLVRPGDLVVVNDTRVLPARLGLRKETGGHVEVLLLEPEDEAAGVWHALVRPGRRVAPGTVLRPPGATEAAVEVGEVLDGGRRRVRLLDGDVPARLGVVPLPPYITRPLADPDRYQTVYANRSASVAAPTAGLHLTEEVLAGCRAAGAEVATVELVVGLDTFRPITVDDPAEHVIHTERFEVSPETMDACRAARRVLAVGTTSVRALESAAAGERSGRTALFIRPGFRFQVVDLLLTNFHLPRSSLLLLIAAFVGPRWRAVYEEALAGDYRFLSFGDAMLLERAG